MRVRGRLCHPCGGPAPVAHHAVWELIEAPGASPGTAGTKAAPLAMPPGVGVAYRRSDDSPYATSQSPGWRRGLLWPAMALWNAERAPATRPLVKLRPGMRVRGRLCHPCGGPAPVAHHAVWELIEAPGASPGTAGTKAAPLAMPPGVGVAYRRSDDSPYATSQSPGWRRGLLWPAMALWNAERAPATRPPARCSPTLSLSSGPGADRLRRRGFDPA